jgi:hypothetical protein
MMNVGIIGTAVVPTCKIARPLILKKKRERLIPGLVTPLTEAAKHLASMEHAILRDPITDAVATIL